MGKFGPETVQQFWSGSKKAYIQSHIIRHSNSVSIMLTLNQTIPRFYKPKEEAF